MKTFEYTITDPVGIHARPAGLLVKAVKEHASKVTITKKNPDGTEKSADAKKLLALMNLGIKQETPLRFLLTARMKTIHSRQFPDS